MITSPSPLTHTKCVSRPPPVAYSWLTTPHSAHSTTPYAAFSTLHPTTRRPSSTFAAAPTEKPLYGAYARAATATASAVSNSQSMRRKPIPPPGPQTSRLDNPWRGGLPAGARSRHHSHVHCPRSQISPITDTNVGST